MTEEKTTRKHDCTQTTDNNQSFSGEFEYEVRVFPENWSTDGLLDGVVMRRFVTKLTGADVNRGSLRRTGWFTDDRPPDV